RGSASSMARKFRRLKALAWFPTAPDGAAPRAARRSAALNDPRAHQGGYDLRDHNHDEDHEQHQAGFIPVEVGKRGIERHAETAATDKAEHGRFAHVDVPAEHRNR